MLEFIALFCFWGLLMVGYIVLTVFTVPLHHLVAYNDTPKDWQYRLGLACFYAIPALWIIQPSLPAPPALLAGAVYFIVGGALVAWSRSVNPFFLPNIETPGTIVTSGPYRYCDHPGYFGFIFMAGGSALILPNPLAIIPILIYGALLVYRASQENIVLKGAPMEAPHVSTS